MKPIKENQTFTQDNQTMQIMPIITKIVFIYYLFFDFGYKGTTFFQYKQITIEKKRMTFATRFSIYHTLFSPMYE